MRSKEGNLHLSTLTKSTELPAMYSHMSALITDGKQRKFPSIFPINLYANDFILFVGAVHLEQNCTLLLMYTCFHIKKNSYAVYTVQVV